MTGTKGAIWTKSIGLLWVDVAMPDEAMPTLIEKLAAEDGNRRLDSEVYLHYTVAIPPGAEVYSPRPGTIGWSVPRDQMLRRSAFDVPYYTTSLDAKLPWENIVKMHKRGFDRVAWHEDPDGRWFVGQAKTEVMARRLAAMAAWEARKARLAEETSGEDHE